MLFYPSSLIGSRVKANWPLSMYFRNKEAEKDLNRKTLRFFEIIDRYYFAYKLTTLPYLVYIYSNQMYSLFFFYDGYNEVYEHMKLIKYIMVRWLYNDH